MSNPLSLLLVEDNSTDRLLVREYLADQMDVDYLLDTACSMAECLQQLGQNHYDALLVDLNLPDSNGNQTLLKILDHAPEIPVIVMTGIGDRADGLHAMQLGAQDFLVKGDFHSELLVRTIRYSIERHNFSLQLRQMAAQLKERTQQLSKSEAHIRELINISEDALLVVDQDEKVQFANPAACELLLQQYDHLIGSRFDYDWRNAPNHELLLPTKSGETCFVEVRHAITHWNEQSAYLLTMRDVTSRKRAQEDLMLFRRLIDQAEDSIVVIDVETGGIDDCNESFLQWLGYTRNEMLKLHVWDINHDITPNNWVEYYTAVLNSPMRYQADFTTIDGHTIQVEASVKSVYLGKHYLIALIQDISERMKVEAQLRQDAEILSRIDDAIIILDSDFKVTYWNDGATRLLGWTPRERLGLPIMDIAPQADDREIAKLLNKTLVGEVQHIERNILNKDRLQLWVEWDSHPILKDDKNPLGVMIILRNIEERRSLEAQLRHSQKMEAIGTLAGGIAHDFNNIMAAIRGYTELAYRRCEDESLKRDLGTVLKSSERATSLIDNILTFSRKQPESRSPLYLQDALAECLQLLRATLPATISIKSNIDESAPSILGNHEQIQQIVLNLGNNAMQAMPNRSGKLCISLETVIIDTDSSQKNIQLQPGVYACISISDTGIGMSPEIKERIFEPFFTTKVPGEGTGLGLSMVHGIMESYNGSIQVDSAPDQGTTFRLYFPAHGDAVAEIDSQNGEAAWGSGERILFVDDEELLAELGQEALQALGYRVSICLNPKSALQKLEAGEVFDLIITDQTMPEMTGLEMSKRILRKRPDQKIIISTGYSPTLTLEIAKAEGLKNLIHKPVSITQLSEAVASALGDCTESRATSGIN
ncbi:hybrid sensor histidine kinase/response regulator [Cerasicoccus fimbriatus]|uniref:hybrid sensor histidine kinase/response regulator n=1 Tax=Cerasicoccus fimbriatus TaxID=3014554 RepID=UPI0022B2C34A|nr:PAS domain S-box protein [Cerasicoccus sp. TK19100]